MRPKSCIFILGFVTISYWSLAQDEPPAEEKEPKFFMNGYLKNMVSITRAPIIEETFVDNLIHNRLNFKWYPNDNFSAFVEFRNRIFFGELVSEIPNYAEFIDTNDDFFDLSWTIVDHNDVVVHAMIDRLFVQYNKNDLEVKLGRQRINWGTTLVWNPNDLFNAYSFFDFDYEERPGADAIRVQYYTGFASSLEVAAKAARSTEELVAAGKWNFNKWNYDVQLLGGYAYEDLALGLGWAGNIKTSGFKGELTYFYALKDKPEAFNALLATIMWDYSFRSSLYVMTSFLYNSGGEVDPIFNSNPIVASPERLTAKNLSPYKYNLIAQTSYTFNPLVNGALSTIYYPGANALFIGPAVTISAMRNFDVDVIAQLFWDEIDDKFQQSTNAYYLRVKWSF